MASQREMESLDHRSTANEMDRVSRGIRIFFSKGLDQVLNQWQFYVTLKKLIILFFCDDVMNGYENIVLFEECNNVVQNHLDEQQHQEY